MGSRTFSRERDQRKVTFTWCLIGIAIAGLILRLVYLFTHQDLVVLGDGFHYLDSARLAGRGRWFEYPFPPFGPDAHHPPLWTAILSSASVVGDAILTYQLTAAAVGTTAILMVGVAGREIAGNRVGLIAASLAALYPGFWQYERELLSEVVLLPLVALVLWLAYLYRDAPSLRKLLMLSATCAILALARAEQVALFAFLVAPLVVATRSVSWTRRLVWLGASAMTALVLIAPWSVYNTARFREPVFLSTGLGTTMVAGACDATFSGDKLGHFDTPSCFYPHLKELEGDDRSEADLRMRRVALDYSRDHATELPLVIAAREGRTFSVYRPLQEVRLASEWTGSPSWVGYVSTSMYWALLPFAIAGVFLLRRHGTVVYPLLVEFIIVVLVAAATFGLIRYRAAIEVPFVILAAVALDRIWSYWQRRRSRVVTVDPPRPEPVGAIRGSSAGVAHARPPD